MIFPNEPKKHNKDRVDVSVMSVIRTINNVKSIRFRKIDDRLDVELITKYGETFPATRYGSIYLKGEMQLDAEKGLIQFDDRATCKIESSTLGPFMTCKGYSPGRWRE